MLDGRLSGRSVLIVEDQLIVAMDLAAAFQDAGAVVLSAANLSDAMRMADHEDISAAVVDFGLGHDTAAALIDRLTQRDIVFVLHSGYARNAKADNRCIVIPKPADPQTIIDAITRALQSRCVSDLSMESQERETVYEPAQIAAI